MCICACCHKPEMTAPQTIPTGKCVVHRRTWAHSYRRIPSLCIYMYAHNDIYIAEKAAEMISSMGHSLTIIMVSK